MSAPGSLVPGLAALAIPGACAVARPAGPGFLGLAAGAGLCALGLVTFGLISFHLVTRDRVRTAGVPLLYAGAALVTGEHYDRIGRRVLLALPFLVTTVPLLAFGDSVPTVVAGALLLLLTVVRRTHA